MGQPEVLYLLRIAAQYEEPIALRANYSAVSVSHPYLSAIPNPIESFEFNKPRVSRLLKRVSSFMMASPQTIYLHLLRVGQALPILLSWLNLKPSRGSQYVLSTMRFFFILSMGEKH